MREQCRLELLVNWESPDRPWNKIYADHDLATQIWDAHEREDVADLWRLLDSRRAEGYIKWLLANKVGLPKKNKGAGKGGKAPRAPCRN